MKLDRLLSIVILLMNRRMVQAKELADLFEVSVRTIYRDIEVINQAGIPITTSQGAGGGIGLIEGYRLDRNLLTNQELAAIMTALQSVSTPYRNNQNNMLMEKINSIIPTAQTDQFQRMTQQFIVDFSSWGVNPHLEDKLNVIKQAIEGCQAITFTYSNAEGQITSRSVHPYTLILKQQKWYLYAHCTDKNDFRMFKVMRMKDLIIQEETYSRQDIPIGELPWNQGWMVSNSSSERMQLVLRFHKRIRHIAEEWFGVEQLEQDSEGNYRIMIDYPEDNWLYGFILSFGQDVEVLQPSHIRDRIQAIAMNIVKIYERT
ncbi:YafY family transcriptional regulator [Paenibacillus albiflavus]|uniref:YafY family transcriptional regulator n=1 Tax=Paenibacillus albiflavus TaxID=2545760 RepID=A0A4R4EC04_9BACL|nr:YafY family protein [Paenibacillus albiflavus]TCZ76673.1 YafY family transcriptional regulator [Paenibacillus albiflavus]